MKYAKATTVRLSGDASDADARMRHDYPILQQFHTRHALGAKAAPSCLCCGQQTHPLTRPIAVQHMELPAIVVCKPCKDASGVATPVPLGVKCDSPHAPGAVCLFGPWGWRGVMQCKYCKQAPPDAGVPASGDQVPAPTHQRVIDWGEVDGELRSTLSRAFTAGATPGGHTATVQGEIISELRTLLRKVSGQ